MISGLTFKLAHFYRDSIATLAMTLKLKPNRTGEGEVLRDNDGSRGHFEESWNSSSYFCWESGSNEELGKHSPSVADGLVVLGNSDSSGLLVVALLLDAHFCLLYCWHQRDHPAV